jgi:hypothetical protein
MVVIGVGTWKLCRWHLVVDEGECGGLVWIWKFPLEIENLSFEEFNVGKSKSNVIR